MPDFVPKPIAWGSYQSSPDTHFYICEFRNLGEELPQPPVFCQKLAELHKKSTSPNGRFGFPVVTYNGNLPQENGFTDTWTEFFSNGLKHMLQLSFTAGGPSKELTDLMPGMFEKVIPRLLKPLESEGRSIKPSLVHGDLWCGNAAVDLENDMPLVFDPCCFWAHNECNISSLPSFTHVMLTHFEQTSWAIGVQSETSSPGVISVHTILIYLKPLRRKIMMIVMPSMRCGSTCKQRHSFLPCLAFENR